VAAVRRRRAGGLTGGALRIGVVGSPRALDALEPLRRAWAGRGHLVAVKSPVPLDELADGVDALTVVGSRRRSPRTVLPGPFVRTADGRRVPVGWVPDLGWEALRRFATAAARVHARSRNGRSRRTVAVLAQRSRRYRDLSGRIERLLAESGGAARPLRWTADELTRPDLVRGLGFGVSAAVYVGHGRPVGWVGYRGVRRHHLARVEEPTAAVLSLTCLTASRRRVGLSFAEALVLDGAAAAAFGAVRSTDYRWNARWALRLTGALANGCATVGDLVVSAEEGDPAVAAYRIIGDPTAPLVDAPGAARRAAALTRELAPPS
jgi:hypothetical protein